MTYTCDEVLVRDADCAQPVVRHRLDDRLDEVGLLGRAEPLRSPVAVVDPVAPAIT